MDHQVKPHTGTVSTTEVAIGRRPKISFADIARTDFESLEKMVKNLLVDNKNLKSGYYFRDYPAPANYIRYILNDQLQHMKDRADGVQETLVGLASDLIDEFKNFPDLLGRGRVNGMRLDLIVSSELAKFQNSLTAMQDRRFDTSGTTQHFVESTLPGLTNEILELAAVAKNIIVDGFTSVLDDLNKLEQANSLQVNDEPSSGTTNNLVEFITYNADKWGVYDKPGADLAAEKMTEKFNVLTSRAFSEMAAGTKPYVAIDSLRDEMMQELARHATFGTGDTEVIAALDRAILKSFGEDLQNLGKTNAPKLRR